MRYSIALKFLAFLLAACGVAAAAGSAIGISLSIENDIYNTDYEQWYEEHTQSKASVLAGWVANRYAAETYSDCPEQVLNASYSNVSDSTLSQMYQVPATSWFYTIAEQDGEVVKTNLADPSSVTHAYTFQLTSKYPVLATEEDYVSEYTLQDKTYYVSTEEGPSYRLTVYITSQFFTRYDGISVDFIRSFIALRYTLFWVLAGGILMFAICAVFLCYAAGQTRHGAKIRPGGLNQLPLELYGGATALGCYLAAQLTWRIIQSWFLYASYNLGSIMLAFTVLFIGALLVIGFIFAIAAQAKTPGKYWWKKSVIHFLFRQLTRFGRSLVRLFSLLPLTWQWLVTALCMGAFPVLFFCLVAAYGKSYYLILLVISLLTDLLILIYGIYAFGTLLKGAKQMAAGELTSKIPTRFLFGVYGRCAEHLNTMADVAITAAQSQLNSERMKTELITNVSHDIKTPLTSIINYVDLLERSSSDAERKQYLEVLGRQSQRLKKLTEDLVEMSKASSGNIPVDIQQTDAVETLNQALGEFSGKLEKANLTIVFTPPAQPVAMLSDGRLAWRVLSNLLSNIVKYAQPGTRVYVDLTEADGLVQISLKNISREPLNMTAEELTERFVRGDVSRHTEGSGLGLHIAKTLMELQNGQLQLLVDGDLFKATLTFPQE